MGKNLNQVPTAAASLLSTDKMYIARSPFDPTDDRYILGSSIIAQFGSPLTTKGDIFTYSTGNAALPVGATDGMILQVSSAAATGLAWSTATYPVTTTVNQLLYSSSANVVTGLATANSGVLITSAGGVPSIGTTLPIGVQTNITELGTITVGVWNGTAITVPNGGTGAASFTAYMPVCGGTTTTGTLQSVSTAGASAGYALTYVSSSALPTWQAVGAPYSPAALTESNDTNVTMTLGGTPSTALLQAVSMTLGWTGTLSLARGGTNAALTASAGGVVYSTGSAMAILSGTATANQVLLSGSSAAPSWSTATYPATTTVNQILYSSSANTIAGLATANSSVLITSAGGVPSLSNTLPIGVQTNITELGTITVGVWNASIIPLAYGGTNADLTASNGGIVWSNASQMQILGGTATAGQMLQSGSTATPAWSTATWPATTTQYQLLYSSFTNVVSGIAVGANGVLISSNSNVPSWLANGTAGDVLTANSGAPPSWQAATGTGTVNSGTINDLAYYAATGTAVSGLTTANNGVLVTSNAGVPSWNTSLGQGLAVASSVLSVGAANNIPFNNGKGIQDSNGNNLLTFGVTASAVNYVSITNAATNTSPLITATGSDSAVNLQLQSKGGGFVLQDSTTTNGAQLAFHNAAGTFAVALQVSGSLATNYNIQLPSADGTSGYPVTTNGSGVWSLQNQIAAGALPAGSLFNFQQGTLTTSNSNSNASFTNITGITVSITPTSSSNKVLVRAVIQFDTDSGNPTFFRLARGGTAIGIGTSVGSRTATGSNGFQTAATTMQTTVLEWLDSPATTSSTTYTVQSQTSGTTYINQSATDTNSAAYPRGVSVISVCEVHA